MDGGYWYRNLREQVRFGPAVADLLGQGHGVFVEVSAAPGAGPADHGDRRRRARWSARVAAPRRRRAAPAADLHGRAVRPRCAGGLERRRSDRRRRRPVDLPTYAFDHQHYWLRTAPATDAGVAGAGGADHPMLGAVVQLPDAAGFTSRRAVAAVPPVAGRPRASRVVRCRALWSSWPLGPATRSACPVLDELVIEAPLRRCRGTASGCRSSSASPTSTRRRSVDVYSQRRRSTAMHDRRADASTRAAGARRRRLAAAAATRSTSTTSTTAADAATTTARVPGLRACGARRRGFAEICCDARPRG